MERHFVDLCHKLSRRHSLYAVAHDDFRRDLAAPVQFHPQPLHLSRYDPRLLARLIHSCRAIRPDIIHTHGSKASRLVSQLTPLLHGLHVVTLHNLDKTPPARKDGCIAVSQGIAAKWPEHVDTVIYNGIAPHTAQDASPLPVTSPRVLAVGRLVPAKGFDVLIEAWAAVQRGTLCIVGDGPERNRLNRIIRKNRLHQRVWLLGYRRDVPQLLRQADLCVIASRREGFSYVFAEALHAGTPLVSTDVPVANEILPPRFIVPAGDPDALARVIQHALDNPAEHRRALEPIYTRYAPLLHVDTMVQQTEQYYLQLLQTG